MNDVPARSAKIALWLLALAGGGLVVAAGARLFFYKPTAEPSAAPVVSAPDKDIDAHVHEFCGHCHAFPPPETFPRSAWKYEVEQGYGFFELYSPPLHAPPIDAVVNYFQDRAPAELPARRTSNAPPRLCRCGSSRPSFRDRPAWRSPSSPTSTSFICTTTASWTSWPPTWRTAR